jgi:hypothetical protein
MKALALPHTSNDWIQFSARVLAVLWAGFWTFFCVASGIGEGEGIRAGLIHQIPAVVFVAIVWLAWRFEMAGGLALCAVAVAAFVFFHMYSQPPVVGLVMAGPPCTAGLLLVLHSSRPPNVRVTWAMCM